jgi:hypothetical protein
MIIIPTLNDDGGISYEEELSPTNTKKVENMTLILDKENPLATKVQTRDGRKARIICVDRKDEVSPIVALVMHHDKSEYTVNYMADGKYNMHENCDDLINVPEQNEDELLPCPFCGVIPYIDKKYYIIECINNACKIYVYIASSNLKSVIRQWNTRTINIASYDPGELLTNVGGMPLNSMPIATKPNQPQWIKCSENTPQEGDKILALCDDGRILDVEYYMPFKECQKFGNKKITHWMPRPFTSEDK